MARRAGLVVLGFTAFYTLFFAPVLFGGRLLMSGSDAYIYHYPALFGGRSLWDPLFFGGYPSFADPQKMLWYPLALPLSLTGWEWLWNPFILSAYVLASCFTYGLVRRCTGSALGATVAGLVYGLSGFLMAHMQHVAVIHGAAWLPLIVWSLEELRRRPHRGWLAALAASVACCFLAGHVQIFVYSLALGGLYVAWHLPGAPAGWWRYGLSAAGGVALGLGLSAVQILPTVELIPHSERARMTFDEFTAFSLPEPQWPQLIFPYVYGGADLSPAAWLAGEPTPRRAPPVPYFGKWNFHELAGACGLLSCVLAGAGLLGRLRDRAAWFWALAAAASVVLALGEAAPLARWLYRIPVVNQFRCPCRFLLWFELAIGVLAGMGVAALGTLSRRRAGLALGAAAAAVLACAWAAWNSIARQIAGSDLFRDLPPNLPAAVLSPRPWENPAIGLPLAGLLLGSVPLALWYLRPGRATGAALLAAVALDLGLFAWFAGWRPASVPAGLLGSAPEPVASLIRDVHARGERLLTPVPLFHATRHSWDYESPLHLDAAPVNLSCLWGAPQALGHSPLGLRRYLGLTLGHWPFHGGTIDQLLALRYLISPVQTRSAHGVEWEQFTLDATFLGAGDPPVTLEMPPVPTTRLGLIAALGCATDVPDGTAVAELTVLTPSGPLAPILLRAGEHVVEYGWERADVSPTVRHRLPPLTESHPTQDEAGRPFRVHHAVSFLTLAERVPVTGVRFRRVGPAGPGFVPMYLTLIDDATGAQSPVHHLGSSAGPWQLRGALADGAHWILENRHVLRRAWLVERVLQLPAPDAVDTAVRTGKLPDGSAFEPYRTALVEEPVAPAGGKLGPDAGAQIERHEAQRVTVRTRAAAEALLVLGDVDYPGWRARVDGRPAAIHRTDAVLRGVIVPPGEHVVEFVFQPRSFRRGLFASGVSALLWLGLLACRRRAICAVIP